MPRSWVILIDINRHMVWEVFTIGFIQFGVVRNLRAVSEDIIILQ